MFKIFSKKSGLKDRMNDLCAPKGTALLVALLVMGILTAVSLGVSSLIVREMGMTRLALDAGRAYYLAEAGVEIGLLQLENNLPGFEHSGDIGKVSDGGYDWVIENLANEYPFFDEDKYDPEGAPAGVRYGVLELNQSVTIPLFVVKDGVVHDVDKFLVQFYPNFGGNDLDINVGDLGVLSGWDVLRWKIYGLKQSDYSAEYFTESINDFTAATILVDGEREGQTNAGVPSWFGSHGCDYFVFPEAIECLNYGPPPKPIFEKVKTYSSDGEEFSQDVYAGVCLPTEAREHYSYDFGTSVQVEHCYSISRFIENHSYNYLSLTNLMNPLVFKPGYSKDKVSELSRLHYRIQLASGDEMVREFAEITSVGRSGDSTIKLNVMKKRDSVLPVFNFALYHME